MTNATLRGKSDAGNLHIRFDEGGVAPEKPRRGSLLYQHLITVVLICGACVALGDRTPPFGGPNGKPVQAGTIKETLGLTDAYFDGYLKTILARRAGWIEKAEAAKPKLIKRDVLPKRMVAIEKSANAFQGWACVTTGSVEQTFRNSFHRGDMMIFDFGEHLVGALDFRLDDRGYPMDAPCRLKFTFGEMPIELAEEPPNPWRGLCQSWMPDEIHNFDFAPADYTLPRRHAFRYVKVEVIDCRSSGFARMRAIAETAADETKVAPFKSDDPLLQKIDAVSLKTLRDCMQTMLEDGPKRDRRLWLGDLRLEALANYVSFRNFDVVKRSIYLLAGTARDNGRVGTDAYEKPHPKSGGCRILDYTALFPTVVFEYLEASNDRATAEDLWPLCVQQWNLVLETVNREGLLHTDIGWWYFIDHAGLDRQVTEQGAVIYGLKGMQRLAKTLGREDEVAWIPTAVKLMTHAAHKNLWKDERGLFVGEKEHRPSVLGQAWMVLAGVPTKDQAQKALAFAIDPKSVIDHARTPYGYHYLVDALYAAGMRPQAEALLKSYWGGMVEKGGDTFWEAYVPGDDRSSPYGNPLLNSYCHAWSCAPTYFLRRHQ